MQNLGAPIINLDQPLTVGSALANDKLNRREFAENAARILARPDESGFAISIEGGWGSGKSSMLAMIKDALKQGNKSIISKNVLDFNPWLVGDRDALLKAFFEEISIKLDKTSRKIAKNIIKYAERLELLRTIPTTGPLSFTIKILLKITLFLIRIFHSKGLESQKLKLKKDLKEAKTIIIIFIDDIDRLSSAEVFEMIRIIKAVGDLPNIRYVCAWDPIYISRALENASIPHADTYLDKVIQVRLPLPTPSDTDKKSLYNEALQRLSKDALDEHFQGGEYRLDSFYFYVLRPLFSHPRDINKIFNIVSTIEPKLRGEIVLSDMIGLAAIMAKAPKVFDLLKRHPEWFAGLPDNYPIIKDNLNLIIQEGQQYLERAYKDCESPTSIENLIKHLFPLTRKREVLFFSKEIEEMNGHLAAPQRLTIALQHKISHSDISLVKVKEFLVSANSREGLAKSLKKENCLEFIEALGRRIEFIDPTKVTDLEPLCLAIGELIERNPFKERNSVSKDIASKAEAAIANITNEVDISQNTSISDTIIQRATYLSLTRHILWERYFCKNRNPEKPHLSPSPDLKEDQIATFSKNLLTSARNNAFFHITECEQILRQLPDISMDTCPKLFDLVKSSISRLNQFITLMSHINDGPKGKYYDGTGKTNLLASYCPIGELKDYGRMCLESPETPPNARAAWKAFLQRKMFYLGIELEPKGVTSRENMDRALPNYS